MNTNKDIVVNVLTPPLAPNEYFALSGPVLCMTDMKYHLNEALTGKICDQVNALYREWKPEWGIPTLRWISNPDNNSGQLGHYGYFRLSILKCTS
jgi:hypothetical protein